MKNILLLAHDDGGQESRFQVALDVTRALNGHLTCLDVRIMPVLLGDCFTPSGEGLLLQEEYDREHKLRSKLEDRLSREAVSWDWVEVTGALAPCMTDAAELADLIITSRSLDDFPYPDMQQAAGEIIVKAGKPLLAVPQSSKGLKLGHPLVAWDGSHEAIRAVHAATPLLKQANAVTILEVDDGSIKCPAREIATYLGRHEISVTIRRETDDELSPGDWILELCREEGYDYVVMGGFGHSRIAEAVFGGVSRKMLTASPVPVLMMH